MTYPSWSKEEAAKRKTKERQRKAEQLAAVNARLAAQGIDWKQLMRMIIDEQVEIKVKEK